jgi:hypothetical protein
MALDDALDDAVRRQAEAADYLTWDGRTLAATPAGRLRLDALLSALLR